jgi:DNA-binding NarL/FixJ family response regulator
VELLLVADHPAQRWSLADGLEVLPGAALPSEEGLARLLHPVGATADAVVLVVGGRDELALLERLQRRRAGLPVVVLAMGREHALAADLAGGTIVLDGRGLSVEEHVTALREALRRLPEADGRDRTPTQV